jgi:endonuclease/exonuclease/phosphatase family metal-dependent hydrolase
LEERPDLQLAVIMGDLNWDDERPRTSKGTDVPLMSLFDERWNDAWRETHPGTDTGYTYDSKLNPMLRGALRRRFDRCLVRPKSAEKVFLEETSLVGQRALSGLIWKKQYEYPPGNVVVSDREVCASDHFGLVVKVRIEPSVV